LWLDVDEVAKPGLDVLEERLAGSELGFQVFCSRGPVGDACEAPG
jgi:hypothetical protein